MGTKINDYCSKCPQKDGCKEVYERLGHSDVPSVAGKVILAFLLPIVLFVGLLLVFDRLLPVFETEKVRTLAVFGLSVGPTLGSVCVIHRARRHKQA